jgi:hypothetical protein
MPGAGLVLGHLMRWLESFAGRLCGPQQFTVLHLAWIMAWLLSAVGAIQSFFLPGGRL